MMYNKKPKMKYCIMAIIIVLCFCLSACQPTPEKEVIVGKNDATQYTPAKNDAQGESQTSQANFVPIEAPEHITEEAVEFTNISVAMDADVVVPDATAYPITEVTKKIFSDEYVLQKIKELSGNDVLYKEWTLNKDELLQKLTQAKQNINIDGVTQESIDVLQKQYENAPATVTNPAFNISDYEIGEYYNCFAKTKEGKVAYFMVEKGGNNFSYNKNQDEIVIPMSISEEGGWEHPKVPNTSEEDAYKIAIECMNYMGADLKLFSTELCSITENGINKSTGFMFAFTREISGMQSNIDLSSFYMNPNSMHSVGAPWEPEIFKTLVDENGIHSIMWNGASEIGTTVANTVQLESFDMIKQRTMDQLKFNYATEMSEYLKIDFLITKFDLGLSMIAVSDRSDAGNYIPTWCVTFENKDETGHTYIKQIMFNAIDGSYVEPRITNKKLMEAMLKFD
ncbi:MAG: DUF6034 family protein [Christensenellaceae bacterium]